MYKQQTTTLFRLFKLNETLSSLGVDHNENIMQLTSLCGELLNATCALYNRLEKGLLSSIGQWHTPENFNPIDNPEGHICFDIIKESTNNVVIVTDLQKSRYAHTDPNVKLYGLKTYMGKAVKCNGICIGSLCVVFQDDVKPDEEDQLILSIIASVIGLEEDRKWDEENIIRHQQRYKAIVESNGDAVCRWVPGTLLTFTNTHYDKLFNPSGKSLVGKRWLDFIAEENRQTVQQLYEELVENPRVMSYEQTVIQADGTKKWFHWVNMPLFDSNGNLVEFQSVGREITEKKKLGQTLEQTKKRP